MDVTVYLPEDIGKRAKAEGLNLSRLLRDAVSQELERRDAVSKALEDPKTYEVALEDRDGRGYVGRITGKEIAFDDRAEKTVYLTTDERILVHDAHRNDYFEVDDPEELRDALHEGAYIDALNALGEQPVVDL